MVAATGALSAPQVDFDNSIDLNMPSLAGVPTDGTAMIVAVFRPSAGPVASTGGVFTMKRTGADALISVAYKRVAGGEAATYNFTCAAFNIFSDARSFVVTGIPAAGDPFDVAPAQNFVSAAASTALSLTTGTANCLLIFVDAHNNDTSASTSTAPSGMTTRGGNPTQLHVFDQVQAAAGATGNKIHTTTVSVNHYACLMAIKAGAIAYTQSADLVGVGTITRVLDVAESKNLVGDGVVTRVLGVGDTESLTGDGTVTRTLGVAESKNLTGDGVITRQVSAGLSGSLTGDGTITEAHTSARVRSFDLIGDGTVTRSLAMTVNRDLVGDGVLDSSKAVVASKTFDLVGDGVITESHAAGLSRSFDLVGDGVISGSADIPFPDIPECAPDWSPNDGLKAIAGTVLFHEPPNQGDPVSGATVCLFRDSDGVRIECTTTAPDGSYSFARDANDPYTYHVEVNYESGGVKQQGLSEGGCVPV